MGVIDKIAIDLSTKLGDKLQKSIEEKAVPDVYDQHLQIE